MIKGDVSKLDLGLSPENRKRILDTNIIFHGAATVRFNEHLRLAININVRGTEQFLLLAKEMPDLKVYKKIHFTRDSFLRKCDFDYTIIF